MTDIDDAYAAGFFDGEGCVSAVMRNKKPSPTIIVTITNTQPAPLYALKEKWGGSIYRHSSKNNGRQQPKFQWVIASKQAKPFLEAIRPHLWLKTEVVEAAIQFRRLMETPIRERMHYGARRQGKGGSFWCSPQVKPEFRIACLKLHRRIREINSRNVPINAKRKYVLSASYPELEALEATPAA